MEFHGFSWDFRGFNRISEVSWNLVGLYGILNDFTYGYIRHLGFRVIDGSSRNSMGYKVIKGC